MIPLPKVNISIFETLLARRSVRHYKARKVGQNMIRTLLEAAIHAPTAGHQEPWGFVVIQDKELLQRLSDFAKPKFLNEMKQTSPNVEHHLEVFSQPEFNIFYNAGTLILICGKHIEPFFEADCWLAAENFMLAASAMGLGTCVIGSALSTLNSDSIKVQLRIPRDYRVVVPVIVGYVDSQISLSSRKPPVILSDIPPIFSH